MPELPEVDSVKSALQKMINWQIVDVLVRNCSLRYKVDINLQSLLIHKIITQIVRVAKYLIITLNDINNNNSYVIIHLGMSGSLGIVPHNLLPQKHDHIDILFNNNYILRYNDPRRFGAIIYSDAPYQQHKLFINLGPEPFDQKFNHNYLINIIKNKSSTIKQVIMNQNIVVGVGNIYASEALFMAKILPYKASNNLTVDEVKRLIVAIKQVLTIAITNGGSSLRDYKLPSGELGNFQNIHMVYQKEHLPCVKCNHKIIAIKIANRNSFYCGVCQC